MQFQSLNELATAVSRDPALAEKIKENPEGTLRSLAAPLQSDVWIYRMVVGALGLAVLIAVIGAIVLATDEKTIPDVLTALGAASIGALAGLLAPSPASKS